jgi:lipoprotein signal peptidase
VSSGSVVFSVSAAAFACLDLAHKATAGGTYVHHPRSAAYVVVVLGLALLWSAAVLATRSPLLALAGGVVLGGALGNVVSLAVWPGVPNPIELDSIAFNLADAFVLLGFATTAAATLKFASRNRERLREPL